MLRWMMPFLVAMFAITPAAEAAGPAGKAAARRAASQLPPGLPRAQLQIQDDDRAPRDGTYRSAQSISPTDPTCCSRRRTATCAYIPPVVGVAWPPGYPAWSG